MAEATTTSRTAERAEWLPRVGERVLIREERGALTAQVCEVQPLRRLALLRVPGSLERVWMPYAVLAPHSTPTACPECQGDGFDADGMRLCVECGGTGKASDG